RCASTSTTSQRPACLPTGCCPGPTGPRSTSSAARSSTDSDLAVASPVPSSIFDGLTSTARPEVRVRVASGWEEGGAAFGAEVRSLAAAMIGYGLAPGAPVAVLGNIGRDALEAELAVLVAGGCLVSPDPTLGETALAHALAASEIVQAVA